MLGTARQWGDIGEHVPDACANIVKNPRKPVARYLSREELERLGAVLDRHREEQPWPVAAIRLLTLTGARLSEVINLRWDDIGELAGDGASARIEDSKTGSRTIWLGPEAARLVEALPRLDGRERVFPETLTSARLYTFWCGIRDEAGLPGLRIHDCRHTWASQGVMNGVGLTTVGRLLGHRKRETTAIYAHLDDGALRVAAMQAAVVIARAMGYRAEVPPLPDEAEHGDVLAAAPGVPESQLRQRGRGFLFGAEPGIRSGRMQASAEDRRVSRSEFVAGVEPIGEGQAGPLPCAPIGLPVVPPVLVRSASSRIRGVPAMRASTSASQTWESALLSLAVPIRVYMAVAHLIALNSLQEMVHTAIRTPPRSPIRNIKNRPKWFARALYGPRARAERAVGKIKRFKRIALRCEKTAINFSFFVAFDAAFILIKSVHRT